MATYREHTDLPVYRAALATAVDVYALTAPVMRTEGPATLQARRCAGAIGANIAEGWNRRRYPRSLAASFAIALGEVGEVQHWLLLLARLHLVPADAADQLIARYREVRAQLIVMSDNPARWCPPPVGGRVNRLNG